MVKKGRGVGRTYRTQIERERESARAREQKEQVVPVVPVVPVMQDV
jgi:hypothetical protein